MTQDFNSAQAYVHMLTGHPDTVMDWRCIHDTNKGVPAHNFRGSLREIWNTLLDYNTRGYGIFVMINASDGTARELANMHHIRTHCVDLDNLLTSADSYQRAVATYPQPHFAAQTSPGKFHLYWLVEPYNNNDFYSMLQRKMRQMYDGDKSVIDATRVLRVPGFYHLKAQPYLVTCWGLYNGPRWNVNALDNSFANVNVFDNIGVRAQLGDPSMAAPSIEWLRFGLSLLNPNELPRNEWMSISAAFKQAGWTLTNEETLLQIWNEWCARYEKNDVGENLKLWHSFRETEVGWAAFERRTTVKAHIMHYGLQNQPPLRQGVVAQPVERVVGGNNEVVGSTPAHPSIPPIPAPQETLPELLSGDECRTYFKDCYFVARDGEIFDKSGRFMNSSQFNGIYGGKHFLITGGGKATDEPWKAALRSTVWTIPKVDHIRFLPSEPPFAVIKDELGRDGLNIYLPINVRSQPGDISPWLNHMKLIMPNDNDRRIFIEYMAHCVKYPGKKIAWAPMFQSTEGTGKGMIYEIMKRSLGAMYVYTPKAQELVSSGSKFNAWMRGKLCIVVNEIKVDERRELIEILKPMITDAQVEVQAKGQDQEMEDNLANWIFFSNFKDAIPISQNGRRYAIFFSSMQTQQDKVNAGIDKTQPYFKNLFHWLENQGGYEMITHYLLNYNIAPGACGIEAPETSSHAEALRISRSPMHVAIDEAIEDEMQGFRGGYVSSLAVIRRMHALGVKSPSGHSIRTILEGMGYYELGRAKQSYSMEDLTAKSIIYARVSGLTLEGYGTAQGYDLPV